MKSSTTPEFRACYQVLPPEIRRRAAIAYRLWRADPRHPSLRFKKAGNTWSLRIGGGYRALALLENETFYWFWLGPHDEYERLIAER
jgi:hypothetical protein